MGEDERSRRFERLHRYVSEHTRYATVLVSEDC
jgi:hypothetical protein